MKVLFLTNIPAPYRVEFFNELGKLCDLTVLYELDKATDRNKEWKAKSTNKFKEVFMNGLKVGSDRGICFSVLKYLKDKTYDAIIIGGYSTPTGMLAIEFLKLNNRPFFLNCDGGIIKNDNKVKFLIKRHFIKSANYWLSTGKNTNEYLINYGAKENKIFLYPFTSIQKNEILDAPLSEHEKMILKDKLKINEKKVIISVGQFIYRKGFDILINSMLELPKEYGVYIIGGKPTYEYLKLKEEYNLKNLHFIEFKTKDKLREFYKVADLFVLATREDIWGLVINEAMAHGLPVITTNKCIAGLELINNGENGFIVPVNNTKELSMKINTILIDKEKCKIMSENNLNKIKKYTIVEMAEVTMKILKSELKKKNVE